MTVDFTSITFEWYNGVGTWVDITADVLQDPAPRGSRGILGTGLLDRLGGVGVLTLSLDNSAGNSAAAAGRYTPGHANCLSVNWGRPYFYPLRITVSYDDRSKIIWRGTFEPEFGIRVAPFNNGMRRVDCAFRDWMGLAQERKLNMLASNANKRGDQAIQLVLDELADNELPQETLLHEGDSVFEAVFDDTTSGTTVYSELAKIAQSELGYVYLRASRTSGEKLVFENRDRRYEAGGILVSETSYDTGGSLLMETGDHVLTETDDQLLLDITFNSVSTVSKSTSECGLLLMETGDYLLTEDSDRIILNEVQDADFDAGDILRDRAFDVTYYDNAYQSARVSVQQKETGDSVIVLWSMKKPLLVKAGATKEGIRGRYRDPSGGSSYINGVGMVTPVASTDYEAFANRNGTGTDLTADITVTAEFGSAEVEYTITNTGATDAYLTTLQARGYPMYNYDSLDINLGTDEGLGKNRLDIDLSYETDGDVGETYAENIIKSPDGCMTIQRLPLWANRDTFNMNAFMDLDCGSLYNLDEPMSATSSYTPFFINGYEFEIIQNKYVYWYPNGFPYSRVYVPAS